MHIAASDFRFDLSLGLLSLLVGGAIAVALLWYLVVLLQPWSAPVAAAPVTTSSEPVGPPAWAGLDELPLAALRFAPALPALPVLTVFRCEARGRVSYGDQPCAAGDMRVLHIPRG
jgi:hypothetical protein